MTSHLQHRDSSVIVCEYLYGDVYNNNISFMVNWTALNFKFL